MLSVKKINNDKDLYQSSNYNGIDLIKFICSILVFVIHIPPLQNETFDLANYFNYGLQHYLCRIAVPFYFVVSGFFLFRKMDVYNLKPDVIKKYCFNVLKIMCIWLVLLNTADITHHLWYLGSSVVAIALVSICFYKQLKISWICVLSCVLYIAGLFGDSYYGIIEPVISNGLLEIFTNVFGFFMGSTRNGIFMGFVFVLIGAIFSQYEIKLKLFTCAIGFVLSMFGLLGEFFLLSYFDIPKDYNMYLFLVPTTIFLFLFAKNLKLKDSSIYKKIRVIGFIIYLTHLLVNKLVVWFMGYIDKYLNINLFDFEFLITLVLSILIAVLVEWLSCKNKFKWIRIFVS